MTRVKVDYVNCEEINGEWGVEAHSECGYSFHFQNAYLFTSDEQAHRFVKRVEARGSIDPELWNRGYPVYGSDAFVDQEREASYYAGQVRAEKLDLDSVPDCFRTLL